MADTRRHRGAHPEDARLFGPGQLPTLRRAVSDYAWLLSRGYAGPSSLKLVGDRHALTARQRVAVARASCSDAARAARLARRLAPEALTGQWVHVDGYNLLITIESALAGGVVLGGRDSSFRDLASMHGTYRTVAETDVALALIGEALASLGLAGAHWWLDAPVSNSGRLRGRMLALSGERGWPWQVELAANPDAVLLARPEPVVTSDSVILDGCRAWANLARHTVTQCVPNAWVVDLE